MIVPGVNNLEVCTLDGVGNASCNTATGDWWVLPTIDWISQNYGRPTEVVGGNVIWGTEVTISGWGYAGFDINTPNEDYITIGGVPVGPEYIKSVTPPGQTQQGLITFWVPEYVYSGPIRVFINGVGSPGFIPFTVCHEPPPKFADANAYVWGGNVKVSLGSRVSMVLDSKGYPHIASISNTAPFLFPATWGEYLVYSYWTGSQWVHKYVDFVSTEYGGSFGTNTSIALGDDGYPRIAYVARMTKDLPAKLKYARWTGSQWVYEEVDDAEIGSVSMVVVGEHAYFCYLQKYPLPDNPQQMRDRLKFAEFKEGMGTLYTQIVDEISIDGHRYVGYDCSLAIDNYGFHIAYVGAFPILGESYPIIKYAGKTMYTMGRWEREVVRSDGGLRRGIRPKVKTIGEDVYILFYTSHDFDDSVNKGALILAKKSGGVWTDEIVDGDVGNGRLGISDLSVLYYHRLGSPEEPSPPFLALNNTHSWPAIESALTIDGRSGIVKVSYYDSDDKVLKLATRESWGWAKDIIDVDIDLGSYNALALDANGMEKIVYFDKFNYELLYFQEENKNKIAPSEDPGHTEGSSLCNPIFKKFEQSTSQVTTNFYNNLTSFEFNRCTLISNLLERKGYFNFLFTLLNSWLTIISGERDCFCGSSWLFNC